jgi:hypothetical protein
VKRDDVGTLDFDPLEGLPDSPRLRTGRSSPVAGWVARPFGRTIRTPATIRPVTDYRVITAAVRPDLIDAMRRLGASPWPEFLLGHDEVVNRLWDRLYDLWPDYQFALADPDRDDLIAVGNCLPIRWDGNPATLPPGGIDAVLENGAATVEAGPEATAASALMIVVAPDRLGLGLERGVPRGHARDRRRPWTGEPRGTRAPDREASLPADRHGALRELAPRRRLALRSLASNA